ncbi:hypothetical protein [Streptomyces liangshanensis]|uniref:Uncharacterized protein n=1 Tax=Streptomyces liangshanensis TaxID=2717324 RepID=A0A6G9H3Z4_9ACTN|nr:hypothetical protein [Streptomyces liangshanensis]QIQ05016.1 hypothetical protein HA039_24510 [Streptomyces liangshanensis]
MTYDPSKPAKTTDTTDTTATGDTTDATGDHGNRSDRPDRVGAPDRTSTPDRTGATDRTSGTDRTSTPDRTTGAERPTGPPATPEVREGREVKSPVRTPEAPTRTTGDTATDRTATGTPAGKTPSAAKTDHSKARFFPQDESDKLTQRLQDALSSFVDGPRRSVEEAAGVLEETAERLGKALAERPRSLRADWDTPGQDKDGGTDTEDLRLALQSYREVTERLLRI